jgi:5-methylthioadenosine/S-adenosylhomocysteine deaminase
MAGDILIKGGPLWAGTGLFWRRGLVEIKAGRVTWAGDEADYPWAQPPVQAVDVQGGLIFPGLVNAHTHGAMTLFRGLADDMSLETWLTEHIFPAEARWVNPEMVELCTLLAAGEMLLSGTTTVCDGYFCMDAAARAYAQAGLRAVVAQGVVDFPAPGVPDPAKKMDACRAFLETWSGAHPLVKPALFAHSAYTCSPATLREVDALAATYKCPWFIHLAETAQEVKTVRARHGRTPAMHLEALGLLEGLTAGVHGIWLTPEEMDLLARRKVALVSCEESNMKLGSGTSDIPAMLKRGITVGLGTDGPASNNDLSMIGELGMTSRMLKLDSMDPTAMPAALTLELATLGSARAMGLTELVGRLEPGYVGDVVVLRPKAAHLMPLYDPASLLVYAAKGGDVRHVVVEGELVVRDRQVLTFDLKSVMAQVRALAEMVRRG